MVSWLGFQPRDIKEEGNEAFKEKRPDAAIELYSEGLEQLVGTAQAEKRATLLSNRSAAYGLLQRWDEALSDAEEACRLAPARPKGWARKGKAHYSRREMQKAANAYARGLEAALRASDDAQRHHDAELAALKSQARTQSEEYERLLRENAALKSQLEDYELFFDKNKRS